MGSLFSKVIRIFVAGDEEAMARIAADDDPRAFAELMERWSGPIFDLCYRMTGSRQKAEDLKQEAFMRVYVKRTEYRTGARFSTWIWQIAVNLCLDDRRKASRRMELAICDEEGNPRAELRAEGAEPDQEVMEREEGGLVREALMKLPEIYRTVLALRHYENLKLKEIAEVLQIPEGTVNSRMAEGLTQMGALLGARRLEARAMPKEIKEKIAL